MSSDDQYDAVSEPQPAPVEKKKREGKKMSDKQKADLTKHMDKMKKGGMTLTEQRSHRMRMMAQLRKDEKMTVNKAHKSLSK
jgi:hypothetical protein